MKSQSGIWPAGELLPIMRGCDGATDTGRRAWDAGSMLQMWRYTLSKPQNGNYLEKNALHGDNTGYSSNYFALRVHGSSMRWVNVWVFYKWGLCTNRLSPWTTQICRAELCESENHPEIYWLGSRRAVSLKKIFYNFIFHAVSSQSYSSVPWQSWSDFSGLRLLNVFSLNSDLLCRSHLFVCTDHSKYTNLHFHSPFSGHSW